MSGQLSRQRFFLQLQGTSRAGQVDGPTVDWDGNSILTTELTHPPQALTIGFEELAEALQRLPRMYLEMDGSFVWRGGTGVTVWQADGLIHDRKGLVQYIEIKGQLPLAAWRQLIAPLGSDPNRLIANLVDKGCYIRLDILEQFLWGTTE